MPVRRERVKQMLGLEDPLTQKVKELRKNASLIHVIINIVVHTVRIHNALFDSMIRA